MGMFVPKQDTNGDPIYKGKVTVTGWTYNQRSIIFKTSLLNSIINKKHDNTAWGDATIKFYNAADTELTTQGVLDTDCVKTVVDWEPASTIDLIGGAVCVLAVPVAYEGSAQLWTVAVPDLTPAQGGSVNMVDGRCLILGGHLVADGRGPKTLYYDAVYHTNKMRTIVRHGAGHSLKLEVIFETFYLR